MVSWLLNRGWLFWLIFLLVVLFVLWIIFGGKSHNFVGLKPLSTDVDSVELVDDQTISNLKYANDTFRHENTSKPDGLSNSVFSDSSFDSRTNQSVTDVSYYEDPSIERYPQSGDRPTNSASPKTVERYPQDLPEPQMTPAIQPLTNTRLQTPKNRYDRPLPSPFRPPSSANFRSIGARTPGRPSSFRPLASVGRESTPSYNQYDYTGKAKSHYQSVINNHRGSLPEQTVFGRSAETSGPKRNIITLKYKPMAAPPLEESASLTVNTNSASGSNACDTSLPKHSQAMPGSMPKHSQAMPKRTKAESRGEAICRRIFEEIYQREFPSSRPDFLKNPETGCNLELDGYNEELGIAFEYNGIQHYIFPNWVHRTQEEFMKQVRRDQYKVDQCDRSGVYLISIPYEVPHNKIRDYIIYYLPETVQKRIDAAGAYGTEVEDKPPGLPK